MWDPRRLNQETSVGEGWVDFYRRPGHVMSQALACNACSIPPRRATLGPDPLKIFASEPVVGACYSIVAPDALSKESNRCITMVSATFQKIRATGEDAAAFY